jgi:hypothetical protein
MELRAQGLGVYYHRVCALYVENADLEQRAVFGGPDKHRQIVIQKYASHRVAHRMPYVWIGDPVLSRRLADPHLDNIACLTGRL